MASPESASERPRIVGQRRTRIQFDGKVGINQSLIVLFRVYRVPRQDHVGQRIVAIKLDGAPGVLFYFSNGLPQIFAQTQEQLVAVA